LKYIFGSIPQQIPQASFDNIKEAQNYLFAQKEVNNKIFDENKLLKRSVDISPQSHNESESVSKF